MERWPEIGEKRSHFLASLRAATLSLSGALALLFFLTGPPAYAQQVIPVPPFVGTHSETWERFGVRQIPNGTQILGGIATISGDHMVTNTFFEMCCVPGRPSDGTIFMNSDRPSGPLTIRFSQPVVAFGAYWGSGFCERSGLCFGNPPSILTFRDVAGNVIGTDSFVYRGDGTLAWRGYRFATPVKTITRTAADGQEGIAVDGLQATVAASPTPTPTPTGPPVVATNPATNIASFSTTLNGTTNPNGLTTAVHFEYGTTTNYGSSTASQNFDGNTPRNVSANLSGLSASTIYHFRIVATNAAGTSYGLDRSFTTLPARAAVADFNSDGSPDYVLQNPTTHQTAFWYLNNNVFIGSDNGPTLPGNWTLSGVADFDRDNHSDYALFIPISNQTVIGYLSGPTVIGAALGPTLPGGWELVATADFSADGYPDYVVYRAGTHQTAIGYLQNNTLIGAAFGPTLPAGWSLVGVADFNLDGQSDYALFNSGTGQTLIAYLSGPTVVGAALGPTVPGRWQLVAAAEFNGDGYPDYVLYKGSTRQTLIAYLNDNVVVGAAFGPTLPAGWSLVAP